jgi:hypothetical protein
MIVESLARCANTILVTMLQRTFFICLLYAYHDLHVMIDICPICLYDHKKRVQHSFQKLDGRNKTE